jgi:hypothetical protein
MATTALGARRAHRTSTGAPFLGSLRVYGRVGHVKIKSDDIKTLSVSEIDKKGTLDNSAVFFASESDKSICMLKLAPQTPVQK